MAWARPPEPGKRFNAFNFGDISEITCDAAPAPYRCRTHQAPATYQLLYHAGVPKKDLVGIAQFHVDFLRTSARRATWPASRHSLWSAWRAEGDPFIAAPAIHPVQLATFLVNRFEVTPFDLANCWAFKQLEYFATTSYYAGMPLGVIARAMGWLPGEVVLRLKHEAAALVKDPRFIWWMRRPELSRDLADNYESVWDEICVGAFPKLQCPPCRHYILVKPREGPWPKIV